MTTFNFFFNASALRSLAVAWVFSSTIAFAAAPGEAPLTDFAPDSTFSITVPYREVVRPQDSIRLDCSFSVDEAIHASFERVQEGPRKTLSFVSFRRQISGPREFLFFHATRGEMEHVNLKTLLAKEIPGSRDFLGGALRFDHSELRTPRLSNLQIYAASSVNFKPTLEQQRDITDELTQRLVSERRHYTLAPETSVELHAERSGPLTDIIKIRAPARCSDAI